MRYFMLFATALVLSPLAMAQWSSRWDSGLSTDWPQDEPRATTVDHRGNVFVVGRSWVGHPEDGHWTMEVVKYDANGAFKWNAQWDNPDSENSDGQAVAVDWEGNVYCAGIAHGSQNGNENHLVILKLNPGGFTVWPNSGSNAGLTYYNGAAMLASGQDGGDVSLAIRDVAGPQPIIAATCQTNIFSPLTKWRTVVFTAAPQPNRIQVKPGWPVDDFGGSEDNPASVAIYTDNTVYVTGKTYPSTNNGHFTTVRYKADGSGKVWTDDWTEVTAKDASGRDIKLDADGNAYVTGYLFSNQNGTEYGTRKILKDADANGNPQDAWSKVYSVR